MTWDLVPPPETPMIRLVQLQRATTRGVACVEEPKLRLLTGVDSIFRLVENALATGTSVVSMIQRNLGGEQLDYDSVYSGQSAWRLLVPIDHPVDPGRTLVSGTG